MRAFTESFSGSADIDDIAGKADVVAIVGDRLCALVSDRDISLDGMVRIPIQTALSYLYRDSTEWVEPGTSTEGRKVIDSMNNAMIKKILTVKETEKVPVMNHHMNRSSRKTMLDVQRRRVAQRERMERWD